MRQIPLTPVLLDSLVTRVEEGDELTQEELDVIGREVQRRPDSLDWRLCFAHALINSDRPHQALEVLNFEGAAGMHEILLHIVRARAYGCMERYPEAEAELKKILRIYPGHADALRALALMRLKEGAPADAVALCESVLLADPLDDYTKQILAEANEVLARGGDQLPPDQPPADGRPGDGKSGEGEEMAGGVAGGSSLHAANPRLERISKTLFYRKLDQLLRERGWKHRIDVQSEEVVVELPGKGAVRLVATDFRVAGEGSDAKRAEGAASLVVELERLAGIPQA